MREFEALIHALGEFSIENLKPATVQRVRIYSDELSGSAHLEICLGSPAWEAESKAIDTMVEIREMYLDDLAIDYVIIGPNDCAPIGTPQPQVKDFVAA